MKQPTSRGSFASILLSRLAPALLAGSALAATACGPTTGTDVGNGAQVSLNLDAYEEAPAPKPQSLPLADGAVIDELWMVVDRMRLRPAGDCEVDTGDISIDGPLVANLVEDGALGGPASVKVPAGPYCRFRVGYSKLQGAPPQGAPADLEDHSVLMRGKRSDGVTFVVRSRTGDDLDLVAKNGTFELAAGDNPLFLAYEVSPWMAALDLGSLGTASIVVDDDQNKDRLDAFEDALRDSGRLFRDQDDDGTLGEDEHQDDDTLAD